MSDSRISGLHRLGIVERIAELQQRGWLSAADAEALRQGRQVLRRQRADRTIENVIGVFGLPFAVAPNFLVNGRDCLVPMVVEEPSIVAGVSFAAGLARATGGVSASCNESLLAGQVHVTGIDNVDAALAAVGASKQELVQLANAVHPRLNERGGGVRDLETHLLELPGERAVVVHLLVDTCDAMGANLVNTICEAVAPRIGEICGGDVVLRILSNLVDRSLVTARVRYNLDAVVRDRIVLASDIAMADPYRAATHNKGIMNGVDAVALATANDWRAIEAGAHAFAASTGRYLPLSAWSAGDNGELVGEITIPLKPGIVGGTKDANPAAELALALTGVETAGELAELMAATGLLQNFAALRALATSGIQAGHMNLHARSVAQSAGVPDDLFDEVVSELVAGGEIKAWRAREILAARRTAHVAGTGSTGRAAGKVILLGEHAAVYGRHALALPIPDAVAATVVRSDNPVSMAPAGIEGIVTLVLQELGRSGDGCSVRVESELPVAMGLGASASFAVAITRAFDAEFGLGLDDEEVNAIAFKCEELAHGTPSGIDNTVATYAQPILFRRGNSLELEPVTLATPPPVVIACSHSSSLTVEQVAGVRRGHSRNRQQYDAIFDQIDALSLEGAKALAAADHEYVGELMNICHGLLNAIGVSTPELESMVSLARGAGAAGAKLTGAGGGGSVIALCPAKIDDVRKAFDVAGYRTIALN